MRLVKKERKFFIDFRLKIFVRQQPLETGAQDRHRSLELMRSVSRVPCRSFEFLRCRSQCRLSLFALGVFFLRLDGQLCDWLRKTDGNEMAGHKAAEQ